MDRMIGECVAVLVDALLPLRTSVGELARDCGDPSDRNGDGGWLREGDLTGVVGLGVDCTDSAGGDGVRGRVLVKGFCLLGFCLLVSCTLRGADKAIEGRFCCSGVGLAASLVMPSGAGLSWTATTMAWVLSDILTISKSGSLVDRWP